MAIYVGDCIEVMRTLGDDSVDSIVTDPPYGISFMAKGWDSFAGNVQYAAWVETWSRECLRVLRPGGHLLAFGGTRTYHALAWGVESAGFEIRDMLEFLYVSGFPHTTDVGSKFAQRGNPELASQYAGYHSGIKPAHEPIVMARKPFTGTLVDNVQRYGTGAVNVDACRIPLGVDEGVPVGSGTRQGTGNVYRMSGATMQNGGNVTPESGRFPANCVTVEDDEWYSRYFGITNITPRTISRKASKKDRNSDWVGAEISLPEQTTTDGRIKPIDNPFNRGQTLRSNHHPTVKAIALMEWLVTLVTPSNGIVLDPFAGSGTTLVAAKRLGFSFIGIERDPEYAQIITARVGEDAATPGVLCAD